MLMAINALYAIGEAFKHHDESVKKPTENSSVDMTMLKDCLSKVYSTDMPKADREAAIDHLKAHALALDIEDSEVAELLGEAPQEVDYTAMLESVDNFVQAEDLLIAMAEAEVDEALIDAAHAKMVEFAMVDREAIAEEFEGIVEKSEQDKDGLWHFTARVAQADKVNKNKRLYPKDEFEGNLPRANRLCKAGRFTGRDGHASMFGDDKPSEICVRYDAVSMQGNDLIMEGAIIPTQAGQNLATLLENGVAFEWSIVGYGKAEYKQDEKGNFTHAVITDYILEGADPIRRGAASTRMLKVQKPKDSDETELEADSVETAVVEESVEVEPVVPAEDVTKMENEEKVEEKVEEPKTDAATVDIDAIVKAAVDAAGKNAAEVAADAAVKASQAFYDAQLKSQALQGAKDAAVAALAERDPDIAKIVGRHFDGCEDAEAVAAKVTEITPQVESMKRRMKVASVGIHTESEKEKGWFNGSGITDRPETVHEVKQGLLDGIEDNGAQNWSNKHFAFKQVLDNYEKMHPEYFRSCTKRGFAETATTSTALGTTLPYVLPMIRQIFPKLIPYEIQSVQPLPGPTGRVYFLDFTYGSGDNVGSSMDDSAVFDSTFTAHTEGETKSQQSFSISHTDLEATENSIYYDITSIVMQDMKALYNLDAEAELLQAGANEIARELNLKYLETIAVGAGIDAGTYGYTKPTDWNSQEKWYDQGFSMWVNHAGSLIGKKFYTEAQWCFCGPTQAKLFASSLRWEASKTDPNEFGYGVKRAGTYDGQLTVYSVAWGEVATSIKNALTFGFYPEDWMHTGSVFAPYIPLYISPQDSDASKNTLSRSVSSRNAMKVLQANAFSKMAISNATGTEVPFTD